MIYISEIQSNFDPITWNNYASHPMQSWEWGEIRKKEGKKVIRLVEKHDDESIQGVYQMTLHPIPYLPYFIGYIPKSTIPSSELISFLKNYGKAHKILFVKFEPNVIKDTNQDIGSLDLVSSSHPLFTPWNQVLDISLSEEQILKLMHHKTRYNIRLAEKKGVSVHEMNTDAGYNIFEKLYFETCKRQRYHGHTPSYHRRIWNTLGGNERIQDSNFTSHILVAFYQDTPLAAYQLWHYKDIIYYVYGGSSDTHKNVMAANLLMWETIKRGKMLGCKLLDMWGSLPPNYDPKDSWAGFTKFKEGYGTKFVEYIGSYDLIIHNTYYRLYTLAYWVRSRLL